MFKEMLGQVSASVSGHAYCCQQRVSKTIIILVKEADSCLICQRQQNTMYKLPWFLQVQKKKKKKCPFDRHIKSSSITRVAAGQGWGGYLPSPTIDLPPSDLNLDISSPFQGVIFSLLYFHSP